MARQHCEIGSRMVWRQLTGQITLPLRMHCNDILVLEDCKSSLPDNEEYVHTELKLFLQRPRDGTTKKKAFIKTVAN